MSLPYLKRRYGLLLSMTYDAAFKANAAFKVANGEKTIADKPP